MKARGWPLTLVLAIVFAGAGWWFGSPWWTLYQMKQAAQAHDVRALAAHVDFPALREDVSTQLRSRFRLGGGLGESLLAGALSRGVASEIVRPEAIEILLATVASARAVADIRAEDMEMRRDGIDQFRMVSRKPEGGELIFRRRGIGWKLAGVRLPTTFRPSVRGL